MKLRNRINPLFIFYLTVIYVFTSFSWWAVLLIDKKQEVLKEKTELLKYKLVEQGKPEADVYKTAEYLKMQKQFNKQRWMVISEGCVFMLLLLFATLRVRHSFTTEMKLNEQQKNFLLSITHELRSPLASTKISLQTLEKYRQLPEDKFKKLIDNSLHDVNRLQSLVENLLFAAKIEDHSFQLSKETINISELMQQVFLRMKEEHGAKRNFAADIDPMISSSIDRTGITIVLMNLMENAVKYSPENSNIKLRIKLTGDKFLLAVADNGIGISESERKKIFKKFYRVGNEDTRKTKGTGLGLFIVEKIVAMHNGTIEVRNNEPNGTVFEVNLPI